MINLEIKDNNLFHTMLKVILYFGFAVYPVYLVPSGNIQVTHYLFLIFTILVFLFIGIQLDKYFYTFLLFLIYAVLVNIFYISKDIYEFGYASIKYAEGILFLTYNFILTISLMSYFSHQKKLNVIIYGLATAISIILFSIFYQYFFGTLDYRYEGYFNNPNQLGYYSVCCFSLIYLLYRNLYIPYFLMIVATTTVVFFSILTLSKAAFISLFLCIIFVIKPFNYKYSKIIMTIIVLSVIFFMVLFYNQIIETHVFSRLINTLSENDSSLKVRGYLVFFEANFLEKIFGMGPKRIYEVQGYEVHSTLMMILSSFGLIGLLIFCLLLLFWVLEINKAYGLNGVICICAPSLLYGLTHNGIRFVMFWIVFAISIFLSKELIKKKNFQDK